MHLAGVRCAAVEVRGAWEAWRAAEETVVVFKDAHAALGATAGSGVASLCVFGTHPVLKQARLPSDVDLGDGPPLPLAPDDVRVLARPSCCDAHCLDSCAAVVLLLDPALAAVRTMSYRVRTLFRNPATRVAIACPWWPSAAEGAGALYDMLASLVGPARRFAPPRDGSSLPRPAVERIAHSFATSELLTRLARACSGGPAETLLTCRRAAVVPSHVLLRDGVRAIVVADTAASRSGLARALRDAAVVVDKQALLEHGADVAPGPAVLIFALQPLVEYEERAAVFQLESRGVRVEHVVAHTWTRDGDAARVDGWAPGPAAERAEAALKLLLGT
jgi:hypothetical protein